MRYEARVWRLKGNGHNWKKGILLDCCSLAGGCLRAQEVGGKGAALPPKLLTGTVVWVIFWFTHDAPNSNQRLEPWLWILPAGTAETWVLPGRLAGLCPTRPAHMIPRCKPGGSDSGSSHSAVCSEMKPVPSSPGLHVREASEKILHMPRMTTVISPPWESLSSSPLGTRSGQVMRRALRRRPSSRPHRLPALSSLANRLAVPSAVETSPRVSWLFSPPTPGLLFHGWSMSLVLPGSLLSTNEP